MQQEVALSYVCAESTNRRGTFYTTVVPREKQEGQQRQMEGGGCKVID